MRYTGSPELDDLIDQLADVNDDIDTGAPPSRFTAMVPRARPGAPTNRGTVPSRVPATRPQANRLPSQSAQDPFSGVYSQDEVASMLQMAEAAAARVAAADKNIRKREIGQRINDHVEAQVTQMLGHTLGGQGGTGVSGSRTLAEHAQFRTMLPLQKTLAVGPVNDTLESEPQLAFRGETLIIDATTGTSLTITDVKVGNSSQLIATGSLSGLLFSPDATRSWLHTQWCGPSKKFECGVTWTGAAGTVRFAVGGVASLVDIAPGLGGLARS